MSVKIYDKKQKKWIIFPGTIGAPGKDAYLIAQENGYTGTKEEYAKVLTDIPKIINSIEEEPTEGSKNLITSGGVWQAIDNVHTTINNQIKSSIVDNLESLAADKSLSANQGRILKEMIANLANLQIEIVDQLPSIGETNIIYLVKKSGSAPDIHDEYVFVDGKWEKIGNTEIDLSNYYTRAEVDAKIPVIPNIETSISGAGNVITLIEVDANNKHKVNATKGISVYTQQEVDDKLTGFGAGDVIAAEAFTTADRVITSNGPGKTVKDSGILISNLALKSYVDEKEIAWDKVTGKPETYVPAAHTHPLAQITDAGALAYKDKVDESDLNFDIPDRTVVDSSLNTSSVNPVQNKVVTEALNNRYTKSETYSQSEIDEKIGSAGGGDVMASGNLAVDYIIIGAGPKSIKNSGQTLSNLALKSEIPSLSGYATQSWVTGQGYSTENTWRPVKVGSTTLNDSSTTLTIANGTGIGLSFSNGTLTITNSAPGSSYTLPVAKNNVLGGIKTGYTESGGAEMAIYVLEDGTAYTLLKDTTVKTALGFTPANVNDIPEIPIALPNPYALNVIAGSSTTSYTGSSASTINLDNIFSKQLPILTNADDAGKPGIYFTNSTTQVNVVARVTKEQPDAIVVVPSATPVVFDEPTVFLMDGIDSLSGGTYKCYCITWIAAAQSGLGEDLILVNGAIYG